MLSHKYKCIFVHIPKTAGQSIERVFTQDLGLSWDNNDEIMIKSDFNHNPKLGPTRLVHLSAMEYVECGHIDSNTFDSYFKFAIVRNPWDRLVSQFRYSQAADNYDFKTFIFERLPKPSRTTEYLHIIPQYDFLFDESGKQLVDFIGRFENLQNDFDYVCEKIGLQKTQLPHSNMSGNAISLSMSDLKSGNIGFYKNKAMKSYTNKHYSSYYDDETQEYVSTLYRQDIETFGYGFNA